MSDAPRFPAGWYADPDNASVHRWWDGARWTEARQPAYGVPQAPTQPHATQPQAHAVQSQAPQFAQPHAPQYAPQPAAQTPQQHVAPQHAPAPQQHVAPQHAPAPQQAQAPQHASASQQVQAPQQTTSSATVSPSPPYPASPPVPSHAGIAQAPAPQHPAPAPQSVASLPTEGPGAPARRDVPTNTVWIWLVVLLPLLSLPALFLLDWRGFVEDLVRQSASPSGGSQSWVLSWTAGSLLVSLVGWIAAAAQIVFAFLDWRTLRARGVDRPFHWAWIFLALVISNGVYVIGRAVVLRRRGLRGMAPVWVWIAVTVLNILVAVGFSIYLFNEVFAALAAEGLLGSGVAP